MFNRHSLIVASSLLLHSASAERDIGPGYDYVQQHTHENLNPNRKSYQTGKPKTVHVVPHSHDDVGWLKTVDEYFYGDQQQIQTTMVGVELTSIIDSLLADKTKTFMEVEMKFFKMWWDEQNEDMKAKTRQLVRNGQFEIVNAGWSMHDEACPIYEDMIDNMMIGHDFVLEEFGVKPSIGWQIDPFGHSNTNARLFAEMGFDAWFFARLDNDDKQRRIDTNEMEFVWMPNPQSLGKDVNIFTHVLFNHYEAPPSFDFEIDADSSNPQFIGDKYSEDFNGEDRAQQLLAHLDDRSSHYMTDEIFCLFGSDFHYKAAAWNYRNLDAMIKYMNENHGDKYFFTYSTPSKYINAIKNQKIAWPTKYDDMFPYATGDTDWWTGYFTSRANAKGYIRTASSNLHSSSILYSQKVLDQSATDAEIHSILGANYNLRDALGILQHHDAVTGTAKQKVANDYNRRIYQGMETNNEQYNKLIQDRVKMETGYESNQNWQQCLMTNSTYLDCPIGKMNSSDFQKMQVAVHNPSTLDLNSISIAIPAEMNFKAQVYNTSAQWLWPTQTAKVCYADHLDSGKEITNCKLEIKALVMAQGVTLVELEKDESLNETKAERIVIPEGQEQAMNTSFEGNGLKLVYKGMKKTESTIMFDVYDEASNSSDPEHFEFSMKYWQAYGHSVGSAYHVQVNAGAYTFHPMEGRLHPFPYGDIKEVGITKAQNEMDITFGKYLYHQKNESMRSTVHISIDKELPLIKIDVDLDSLPLQEVMNGYDVVPNFHIGNFDNDRTFYTDSNGLEMQKRVQDYRPTWILNTTQKVTDNYYPINSAISIQDVNSKRRMTVMNDRSQGGTSIAPGTIELMQNRETPSTDGKGVGEALREKNEYGNGIRVKATYYVQICDGEKRLPLQRLVQHKINDPANYFFNFNGNITGTQSDMNLFPQFYKEAGVIDTVKVVHVPKAKNHIHLRLQNLADLYDSNSKTATINLSDIATALWNAGNLGKQVNYQDLQINELSLTGNMELKEMQSRKIKWFTVDDDKKDFPRSAIDYEFTQNQVKLEPQRIRVFSLKFSTEEPLFLTN